MEEEHRRLAALMFTDIVGYSALTQQNETLTLTLLEEHRRLLRPLFSQYGGKEIKTTGDGFLVEFASAVEAARCAIAVQTILHDRNAAVPAERKIQIRIGLHVGDIVDDENDVFGDGVNIAARIEPLAPPVGICLSQQVFDQVQRKIDDPIINLGKKELKNIRGAGDIHRIVLPWEEESLPLPERGSFDPQRKKIRAVAIVGMLAFVLAVSGYLAREHLWQAQQTPAERIALAVLPFHVLTALEEIGYLSIGIPDAIITQLANVRQMRLRPTSAILRYENQTMDLQEVGRALKTDNVLSGTVQRVGDRFRVSVQLVRVSDGVPLWGEHYDLAHPDLLGLQDAIARQVTTALKIQMTANERERVSQRYTENIAAYQLYLLGRSHQVRYTKDGTRAAVEAFEAALRLDPNYALAHAGLATASAQMRIRFAPEAEVKSWEDRAKEEAHRALELDPHLAEAHEALAAVYRNAEFDWERTIEESSRALELNPNLDLPHLYRAAAFFHLGLPELVEYEVQMAMEINPGNRVEPLRVQGTADLFDSKFAEAVSLLEQAQKLSEALTANWYLAQAYHYHGEREQAETMLAQLRGSGQVERRAQATRASFLAARGEHAQAEELIRAVTAGTYIDHHVAYSLGVTYAQLGQGNQALRWLRNAADTGFPCYPWYERDALLQPLHSNPEFQRFMEELRKSWEVAKARYAP
ncbi:MAG TPA: adenylate/guanylate cyclase domain-containing protein [Candidatus Binatia bacterium]|nr:adenylate/guanylate cyclase domain-containing protein [Candidatus Binatia bacterium]